MKPSPTGPQGWNKIDKKEGEPPFFSLTCVFATKAKICTKEKYSQNHFWTCTFVLATRQSAFVPSLFLHAFLQEEV